MPLEKGRLSASVAPLKGLRGGGGSETCANSAARRSLLGTQAPMLLLLLLAAATSDEWLLLCGQAIGASASQPASQLAEGWPAAHECADGLIIVQITLKVDHIKTGRAGATVCFSGCEPARGYVTLLLAAYGSPRG